MHLNYCWVSVEFTHNLSMMDFIKIAFMKMSAAWARKWLSSLLNNSLSASSGVALKALILCTSEMSFSYVWICHSLDLFCQHAACFGIDWVVILPVTALWSEKDVGSNSRSPPSSVYFKRLSGQRGKPMASYIITTNVKWCWLPLFLVSLPALRSKFFVNEKKKESVFMEE